MQYTFAAVTHTTDEELDDVTTLLGIRITDTEGAE